MRSACACPDAIFCFHDSCIPRQKLRWSLAQIIENPLGYIRLADPDVLLWHGDGSVSIRDEAR